MWFIWCRLQRIMSKHETNSRFTDDMNAQKRWNNVAFSITNIDIKPTIGAIQLNTKSMAMESFIHYSLTDLHCVLFFFGLVHSFFNFRTAAWNGAKIDSALRWQVYLSRFVSSFYSLQQFTFVWDSVRITLKWLREIERERECVCETWLADFSSHLQWISHKGYK